MSGLENQYWNSLRERKTCGMRKCIRLHSSISEFWSGVPVSSKRRCAVNASSVCQRCDLKFLMLCASSSTM